MTSEIRVGDRFKDSFGGVVTVVEDPENGKDPCKIGQPCWAGVRADGYRSYWTCLEMERLPPSTETSELAVGTVIRDPAILKAGMRVRWSHFPDKPTYNLRLVGPSTKHPFIADDEGWDIETDLGETNTNCLKPRSVREAGLTFLGWADTKPAVVPVMVGVDFGYDPPAVAVVPLPPPSPKPPFRYLEDCPDSDTHDGEVMCKSCEGLIFIIANGKDRRHIDQMHEQEEASSWRRSQTWTPGPSGLGSVACDGLRVRR